MANCHIEHGSLYYEIVGEGQPLLLLAGLASDIASWATIKKALSKKYQLILLDNRGSGRTKSKYEFIGIEQMTQDVGVLLDTLGINSAHILGHSMGGMIAMNLAKEYPQKINKLILAATSPKVSVRNTLQFRDWITLLSANKDREYWYRNLFYWLYSDAFFEHPNMLTAYMVGALSYPYPIVLENFQAQVEAAISFDGTEFLQYIKAKTLVIHAENDKLFDWKNTLHHFQHIPSLQTTCIANAGHSLHIEQAKVFVKVVNSFIES